MADTEGAAKSRKWTFLTNHAHVLVCVSEDPNLRLKDIAARAGITERATQLILSDLVADGYVIRTKVGRRNRYEVAGDRPLRHPLVRKTPVKDLLSILSVEMTSNETG
jgi:hypothetical protein